MFGGSRSPLLVMFPVRDPEDGEGVHVDKHRQQRPSTGFERKDQNGNRNHGAHPEAEGPLERVLVFLDQNSHLKREKYKRKNN